MVISFDFAIFHIKIKAREVQFLQGLSLWDINRVGEYEKGKSFPVE